MVSVFLWITLFCTALVFLVFLTTPLFKKVFVLAKGTAKENRLYIRVEFRQSLGMNFVSPFQPKREFKVYKLCKCSQTICIRVH